MKKLKKNINQAIHGDQSDLEVPKLKRELDATRRELAETKMGWTTFHAVHYKDAEQRVIDRKAECTAFITAEHAAISVEVLKAALRNSTYYAAVKVTSKATATTSESSRVVGIVCQTKIRMADFHNISVLDMSEDEGPSQCACPIEILKLLSPTQNETAVAWRQACYENAKKRSTARSTEYELSKLPVGTEIKWTVPCALRSGIKAGSTLHLKKTANRDGSRLRWSDSWCSYGTKLVSRGTYVVCGREEARTA